MNASIWTVAAFLSWLAVPGFGQELPQRKPDVAPVHSGLADVPTPTLYYEVAGEGRALVLIHGGQLDRRMWDDQFQLFAKQYRVIRYDVRGYGKSDAATKPYSDVVDLLSLLRFFKVRKAHLVGLSLGGRIAIDFTVEYPDMVESLTAVGAGLSGFDAWSEDGTKRFLELLRVARDEGPERTAELWLKDPLMAPAMENAALAPRLRQLARANARCWLNNPRLNRPLEPPAIKRLESIRAPTHLVVGARDDVDIHAILKVLQKGIPHAKTTLIEGAGHMVNMEKPDEFSRAVLEFLPGEKSRPRPR